MPPTHELVNRPRRRASIGAGWDPGPSPTSAAPLLLRVDDVCRLLSIGRTQAWQLVWAGQLPVVRIGRAVRIPRADLERWVQERTAERLLTSGPVDGTDVDRTFGRG